MRRDFLFAVVPDLPRETKAELAAEVASLRSEVERIFGKGTREAVALIEAIEDDVQDALLRGLENLHTFHRNGGSVRAWISTIAHNLRVDRARASRREDALFSGDEGQLDVMPAPQRSPETLAMLRDACRRVSEVMDRMEPKSKRAFVLFYFDGLSHADVGATLGLTEAAAKMRCRRAYDDLVAEVGEHVMDVLNDLRCRLPPMFFDNERVERLRVARRRQAHEATRQTASVCAMLVASMLAGFRVEMPLARTGLQMPCIDAVFVQIEPAAHGAPVTSSTPARPVRPTRTAVAEPARRAPAPSSHADPSLEPDAEGLDLTHEARSHAYKMH